MRFAVVLQEPEVTFLPEDRRARPSPIEQFTKRERAVSDKPFCDSLCSRQACSTGTAKALCPSISRHWNRYLGLMPLRRSWSRWTRTPRT